jgi:large subunit ribosomal protein L29
VAERKPRQGRSNTPTGRGRQRARKAEPVSNPEARLAELREEMFRLRFQFATRQLTNTSRIRTVRREIARMLTLQRQQELMAAQTAGAGR